MKTSLQFTICCIFMGLGVVSFFQVSSYAADMNNLNAMYIVAGIVLCLSSIIWIAILFAKQGPKPKN